MLRILPPATFNFDSSVRLSPWVGVAESFGRVKMFRLKDLSRNRKTQPV